jgi:nucleoside-diphosphate-sugar epimerase
MALNLRTSAGARALAGAPAQHPRLVVPATRRSAANRGRATSVLVRADKCLVVNCKSGGHSFIGLYLAKALIAKGHDVTLLNDGDQAKLSKKAPCDQYGAVPGLKVVWDSPANAGAHARGADFVYDNNGKDLDACGPVIDAALANKAHYVFVASAGAYKGDAIEPMLVEGMARKASAGHVEVEARLAEEAAKSGLAYTVFQPLYLYGPHTSKDCEQWFVDRVARDRPVPIPAPGVQLVTLTHVEDAAAMLAAVPEHREAARGQQYNVCSDRAITFTGIAKAVAKAMGKADAKVVLYDPEAVGTGKKGKADGFPFRTEHFFASADKAKRELGWTPKHDFLADVADRVAEYKALGRDKKEGIDFSVDDKVLAALGM